ERGGWLVPGGDGEGTGRRRGGPVSGLAVRINRFEPHAAVRRDAGFIGLVGRVHRVLIIENAAALMDTGLDRGSLVVPRARQEKSGRQYDGQYRLRPLIHGPPKGTPHGNRGACSTNCRGRL